MVYLGYINLNLSWTNFMKTNIFIFIKISSFSLAILTGCDFPKKEGIEKIYCGNNSTDLHWQLTSPKEKTNRFAILLAGSPVMDYFSKQGPQSEKLSQKLVEQGFNVFEVKYPDGGFYSVCGRQGLDNISAHCSNLYDVAVKHLNFDSNNPNHQLVGIGWSIGAIQLQAMSFMNNKRIDNIALTGVLLGDVERGCKSFIEGNEDGYSWGPFHPLVSAVTINGNGCFPESEFTSKFNFENQKFFRNGILGVFEGEAKMSPIFNGVQVPGNIGQAKYIEEQRKKANAPIKLFSYPHCGHELMECTQGKVVDDILDFVANK
jgi:hypothetical protein